MGKKTVMFGMVFGATIGGYIPTLFGAGIFDLVSIFFSFLGGVLGIWLSWKLIN